MPRSDQSHRAEAAFASWSSLPPSHRPIALARHKFANVLDEVLHERWKRGDESCSNSVLAHKYLCVTERTVRQWRDAEKAIPWAAATVLPSSLVDELEDKLRGLRGRSPRRGLVQLRAAREQVERDVRTEDQTEMRKALIEHRNWVVSLIDGMDGM